MLSLGMLGRGTGSDVGYGMWFCAEIVWGGGFVIVCYWL